MTNADECPYCHSTDIDAGNLYEYWDDKLARKCCHCNACNSDYNEYYKLTFIGCEANGKEAFPAAGESKDTMEAAGVDFWYR